MAGNIIIVVISDLHVAFDTPEYGSDCLTDAGFFINKTSPVSLKAVASPRHGAVALIASRIWPAFVTQSALVAVSAVALPGELP